MSQESVLEYMKKHPWKHKSSYEIGRALGIAPSSIGDSLGKLRELTIFAGNPRTYMYQPWGGGPGEGK